MMTDLQPVTYFPSQHLSSSLPLLLLPSSLSLTQQALSLRYNSLFALCHISVMTTTPSSQTLTYKTVGALAIELELYLPPTPQNTPILLWFHGGGLLQGQRKSVAPHMLRGVEKYGYALVSADCK
jgi:acetyl esterase/lipase